MVAGAGGNEQAGRGRKVDTAVPVCQLAIAADEPQPAWEEQVPDEAPQLQ